MRTCDRCRKPTSITITSWFNTQDLCDSCREEEEAHPDCAYAKEVENAAVLGGDYNFPGVGWPGKEGRVHR